MYGHLSAVSLASIGLSHDRVLALALWLICAIVAVFFLLLLANVKRHWSSATLISTQRAERSCDTVLNICVALVATTLTILPILGGKIVGTSYLIPVAFALAFFLTLLVFTIHLRFNFLWRLGKSFEVSAKENLRFAIWLTTATSSLVLGIFLLAVLAIALTVGWVRMK